MRTIMKFEDTNKTVEELKTLIQNEDIQSAFIDGATCSVRLMWDGCHNFDVWTLDLRSEDDRETWKQIEPLFDVDCVERAKETIETLLLEWLTHHNWCDTDQMRKIYLRIKSRYPQFEESCERLMGGHYIMTSCHYYDEVNSYVVGFYTHNDDYEHFKVNETGKLEEFSL